MFLSFIPIICARSNTASLLNTNFEYILPPKQRRAAAPNTPSGDPPIPIYMSIPLSSIEVEITALTSPSGISLIRAPVERILLINSL